MLLPRRYAETDGRGEPTIAKNWFKSASPKNVKKWALEADRLDPQGITPPKQTQLGGSKTGYQTSHQNESAINNFGGQSQDFFAVRTRLDRHVGNILLDIFGETLTSGSSPVEERLLCLLLLVRVKGKVKLGAKAGLLFCRLGAILPAGF